LPYREFELQPHDVLSFSSSSGGGYGDPLEREPTMVVRDVFERLVSTEAARDIYGVITDGERLDIEATGLARARLREERTEDLEREATTAKAPHGTSEGDGSGAPESANHPLRENLELAT
jgi:hypothetical protein